MVFLELRRDSRATTGMRKRGGVSGFTKMEAFASMLEHATNDNVLAGNHYETIAKMALKWNSETQRNHAFVTRECRRNSRKTTWVPPLGKMRPLPATASQGKSPVPP